MAISFSVLAALVVLFVWNRFPIELVAIGAALTLYATDVLELDQVLSGFGDPTVIFIATLFVVSEGLDATGVTGWAGQQMVRHVGDSRSRLVALVMLLVAALTSLISVNGAVAALLPMVVVLAVRLRRSPSQLLMPLAFGAHAGSMLALTGTPVNVIVSDAAADVGGRFDFFEFALAGVPLLAGTIVVVVVLGPRVLPDRTPRAIPPDLSRHARTLFQQYTMPDGVVRLRVLPGAAVIGRRQRDVDLAGFPGAELLGVQADGSARPDPDVEIGAGDVLIVRGGREVVDRLAAAHGLSVYKQLPTADGTPALLSGEFGVAEVVVPPRSSAVGLHVFPGMATSTGDLVVVAVQRGGEDQGPAGTVLAAGDTLLLRGTWDALDEQVDADPDVLVVDAPRLIRRQALPLGPRAPLAVAVLAGMVLLLATGATPAAVAGLLAAGALIVGRVMTIEHAYRSITWTTVVLVAAMIPVSEAMRQSGAAERVAEILVDVVGDSGPYPLAIGLFVVTVVLGQLISNMATALIVIPIAVSAATESGTSARPLLMTVNVAAAAALLTPVATPANLMVMGPAGYRFSDYWKLGLPLLGVFFVVAVFVVPVFWSY